MVDYNCVVKLPMTEVRFSSDRVTFSFEHIKSRYPSVVYFRLYCYDLDKQHIATYTSSRKFVDAEWQSISLPLTVPQNNHIAFTQIRLIFDGIVASNPVYFNGLMFEEGEHDGYHRPNEKVKNTPINFKDNKYVNLYNPSDSYLQVIRPNKDKIHTDKIDGSNCTVLAPHFSDDEDFDDDVAVFFEFANQREQTIDVLR